MTSLFLEEMGDGVHFISQRKSHEAAKIVDSLFIMDFTEVMLSEIGSHGDYSKHTQLGSTYDLRDHYYAEKNPSFF